MRQRPGASGGSVARACRAFEVETSPRVRVLFCGAVSSCARLALALSAARVRSNWETSGARGPVVRAAVRGLSASFGSGRKIRRAAFPGSCGGCAQFFRVDVLKADLDLVSMHQGESRHLTSFLRRRRLSQHSPPESKGCCVELFNPGPSGVRSCRGRGKPGGARSRVRWRRRIASPPPIARPRQRDRMPLGTRAGRLLGALTPRALRVSFCVRTRLSPS